jgi:hypothetical protein
MESVLPEDHLLLASSKRVKALILEEIAIDTVGNDAGMSPLYHTNHFSNYILT